ncbi:MAG TPA: hypothetical protein VK897_22860 [Anaerolineales bacterium]|nr:hypothetical protein [Anaerolineales bacterium]
MRRRLLLFTLLIFTVVACNTTSTPLPVATSSPADIEPAFTNTVSVPTSTGTDSATTTPVSTETPSAQPTNTSLSTVESLKASVTADLLSCRYGPGPEYLYLFAFRAGANIELIGRVDAENWEWVLVENQVPCWVHANFLNIEGDILSLPVVYPSIAKLPITPYYPPSAVFTAERDNQTNEITVSWKEVPVNLGDYEDDSMQTYIIEVWRCQDGRLIFDPLATRFPFIQFVDEPGCSEASHGRVWVQEKHGYAGPAEIPWPDYDAP